MSIASKLADELGPDPTHKSRPRSSASRSGSGPSIFALANEVDTLRVLDRLGIAYETTPRGEMAVCPGCDNEGALVCDPGGLRCMHDTCKNAGVPSKEGFRLNVDLVGLVKSLQPLEAAKQICEWFGIEVPAQRPNAGGDEPPDWYDTERSWDAPDDSQPPEPPDDDKQSDPQQPAKQPGVIESLWVNLSDSPEWLTDAPPPQTWLLKRWHEGRDQGVFPRGRTGLLNATGGVGKTYSLIQLGLAVASAGFWFETFRAAEAGHVLFALAEEDVDEARRRLWRAANALDMTPSERREIAGRIHLLPLAGVSVALTCSPTKGSIVATEMADELRQAIESQAVDWALIIIDPLSRWAGGGVEADNEAATRFCQVVETLTTVRGNPSVLVAHHSSKTSAKDGTADARGVTGIRDGFRWQVTMDAVSDGSTRGILLRNRKSNYSLEFDDLVLVKNQEPGTEGTLRLATPDEASRLVPGKKSKAEAEGDVQAKVLAVVASHPGLTSMTQIAERTPARKSDVLHAVKVLRGENRLLFSKTAGFYVNEPESAGT